MLIVCACTVQTPHVSSSHMLYYIIVIYDAPSLQPRLAHALRSRRGLVAAHSIGCRGYHPAPQWLVIHQSIPVLMPSGWHAAGEPLARPQAAWEKVIQSHPKKSSKVIHPKKVFFAMFGGLVWSPGVITWTPQGWGCSQGTT